MDSLKLQQREVEEDFKECVLSGLQEVKHHLAELTEEVKLVKGSSTGTEMEQIKSAVAESNSIIKLLAADLNTTRTLMLSEFRNVMHAIPRKDALQEQLIAVKEEVQKIRQVQTETQSQLGAPQLKFCDVKGALQQNEMDLSDSNNRHKELQKHLQATGDELLRAQKQVCVLKGELIRVKSESPKQLKVPQTQLSDIESFSQQARKHLLERKDIQNEFQGVLQTEKVFEGEEDVGRLKMESFNSRSMTSVKGDDLVMPNYMKPPRMNQQAPSFRSGERRQSKEKKIISRPSTASEDKLARSDNAWKPDNLKKKNEKGQDENEELLRRFKSILNKLTPQNFQKLMNQTMQLPINSEERLKGVIDLVFEKAIMEPGFSQAYANMCRVMQSIEVKKADGEPVQFRKLILIKCQKQFETDRSDEQVERERQRIMAITNEKEREEALAELEYQQMTVKKQIIGNIRLIGEFFKLQLLTQKTMQNCIFLLLKAKDEESLECMANLVTTVGQSLDHVKGKALMDQYFHQIDKIIKQKQVSPRIRFMLQDLKDLRGNNWKPRRKEAKPVMIDQIRKEARRPHEKMEKYQDKDGSKTQNVGKEDQVAPWQYVPSHKGRVTKRSESRLRGAIEEYLFVKDFKEVTSSFIKNTSRTSACVFIRIAMETVLDQETYMRESMGRLFQKMLTESIISVEQFQIGLNEFLEYKDEMIIDAPFYWTYVGEIIGAMAAEGAQNFSFLKESGQMIEKHFAKFMAEIMKAGVKYTSEQDMNRVWQASGFKWDTFLPEGSNIEEFLNVNNLAFTEIPMSKASHASIGEQSSLESFQKNVIQKNLTFTEQRPVEKAAQIPPKKKNRIGNFQRDLMLFQKDNLNNNAAINFIEEVTACIKELKSPKLQHIFVRVSIEDVLEKKAHMRESIGRLFHRLLDDSTISLEQFKIGLKEILECADDMAIDIPLYWTYLGEIIGGMAAEGAQNFAFLKESVLMVQGKSAKFMAEIMKAGVKYTNEQQMYNVWRASNFTWDMFLPQGSNVKEFLMDNNLTFTEQPVEKAAQIPPKEENRIGNFQRDLMLFQKDNLNNNAAINFIEETIPPELRKTKEFIRALVSAVCYGAVKGEGTNIRGDYELLKSRSVIMKRYINGNPELELQALYAVQHLNNSLENPPALLRLYFDVLYDEDVISEDTFYAWRDSQDPNEKNGKGIALKSVTSFYTWLEESDPPS